MREGGAFRMRVLSLALVLIAFAFFAHLAECQTLSDDQEEQFLSVVAYEMRPAVFMPRDVGTVTITLKNAAAEGSDGSVSIKSAYLLGRGVEVLSKPYHNIGTLPPGERVDITFTVRAPFKDGIYYPKLLVETESGEIKYSFPLRVERYTMRMAVESIPDEITSGERALLRIAVGNERSNGVAGVRISAKIANGSGEVVPSDVFIGALAPDEKKVFSLNFTPFSEGVHTLILSLSFKNGMNTHTSALSIDLNASAPKKRPEIVISGIEHEFDAEMNAHKIKGDISNAGLSAAKGVVMRVGEGARFEAVYPYPSYFIGSLNPDDFSSFELDVRILNASNAKTVSIPIIIEFRDEDGNIHIQREYVQLEISSREDGGNAEISPILLGIFVIIVVTVPIFIIYSWKRRE